MSTQTPQAQDWNNYWSLDSTEKFTKVSWSKRRLMKLLMPYVIAGNTALDAGCGSGFFSKFFTENGMKVTSLDYSQEALNIAEKMTEGKSECIKEDLLVPGLKSRINRSYDLIFTDGLFEHFSADDQDIILGNLKSVLSDKGVIVTVVPNKFSPWELIRPLYMPGIEEDPFTMRQLLDLHARSGLNVMAKGGLNTFPFRISPDGIAGEWFGMLLYNIARQ